jgi:D-alanyl-D-alanine dipeptidase
VFKALFGVIVLMVLMACHDKEWVLIADARVIDIPIVENHEPFVDLRQQSFITIGPSPEVPNNQDYTFLRQSVYEGYRSLELQAYLFQTFYDNVQKKHPNLSKAQLFLETIKLVSPIQNLDGTKNIPPHATGGAIDVYLIEKDGQLLDMGMHPKDWLLDVDGHLSKTNSPFISSKAQKNRLMMSKALLEAGFVNYPTEYWHWSYGDKYWAFMTKHPHAFYGLKAYKK